jgi:hypothetical protein
LEFKLGVGELMLVASLLLDGLTGTIQESILHGTKPSSNELMLALNVWSMALLSGGTCACWVPSTATDRGTVNSFGCHG